MATSDVAVLAARQDAVEGNLSALRGEFAAMREDVRGEIRSMREDFVSLKVALATLTVKVGVGALVAGTFISVIVSRLAEQLWK